MLIFEGKTSMSHKIRIVLFLKLNLQLYFASNFILRKCSEFWINFWHYMLKALLMSVKMSYKFYFFLNIFIIKIFSHPFAFFTSLYYMNVTGVSQRFGLVGGRDILIWYPLPPSICDKLLYCKEWLLAL